METRPKILVVDDTAMFRELESLCLSRAGSVITARDGVEGLAAAQRERPHVVAAGRGPTPRLTRRRPNIGSRWINISAASSMRFCICFMPDFLLGQ